MKSPPLSLPYLYTPRSYQRGPFEAYRRGVKRIITVWHRKCGKDITAWNFTIVRAVEKVGMYWYMLPTVEQAKKVIWYGFSKVNAVDEDGEPAAGTKFLDHIPKELLSRPPNNSDYLVTLRNGSMIQLVGSDKLESIVGPNPIGVVFSEYAIQFPSAWQQVVSPILEQNGGWAWFNSTPRGRNHMFQLWEAALRNPERWYHDLKTIEDTRRDCPGEDGDPVITRDQIDQMRAEGQDEDILQQEYYCSFYGTYAGAYYAKQIAEIRKQGQVREVKWDPAIPVFTVWDLGVGDFNSIWFAQVVGRDVRLIDYYQNSGEGLVHYVKEVKAKPYVYSNHWAPHDIEVREYGTGESRKEAAAKLGIYFRVVPNLARDDGIDAARRLIPRCFFDRVGCDLGLRCLENYSRDMKPDGTYQNFPKHDKWSHGADAFRYLALIHDRENSEMAAETRVLTDFEIFPR